MPELTSLVWECPIEKNRKMKIDSFISLQPPWQLGELQPDISAIISCSNILTRWYLHVFADEFHSVNRLGEQHPCRVPSLINRKPTKYLDTLLDLSPFRIISQHAKTTI